MSAMFTIHSTRIPERSSDVEDEGWGWYEDMLGVTIPRTVITETDLSCFHSNSLGSKWFSISSGRDVYGVCRDKTRCVHWNRITISDRIDIGEVSWLKAALFDDDDYVPHPIESIAELIGENLPILDADLSASIIDALSRGTTGCYDVRRGDDPDLLAFLERNAGYALFTVSW